MIAAVHVYICILTSIFFSFCKNPSPQILVATTGSRVILILSMLPSSSGRANLKAYVTIVFGVGVQYRYNQIFLFLRSYVRGALRFSVFAFVWSCVRLFVRSIACSFFHQFGYDCVGLLFRGMLPFRCIRVG